MKDLRNIFISSRSTTACIEVQILNGKEILNQNLSAITQDDISFNERTSSSVIDIRKICYLRTDLSP